MSPSLDHLENGLQHADDRAVRTVLAFCKPAQAVEVTEEFVGAVDKMDDHFVVHLLSRWGETLSSRRMTSVARPSRAWVLASPETNLVFCPNLLFPKVCDWSLFLAPRNSIRSSRSRLRNPARSMRIPGSTRLQRVGRGILPRRTFLSVSIPSVVLRKSSRSQNAIASTLQACAPQTSAFTPSE